MGAEEQNKWLFRKRRSAVRYGVICLRVATQPRTETRGARPALVDQENLFCCSKTA